MAQRGRPQKKSNNSDFNPYGEEDFDLDKKMKSIDKLGSSIKSVLDEMDSIPNNYMAPSDLLPGIDFQYEVYDYDKDIELIKEDAKETLECISTLYLNNTIMKKKNVMTIVRNDAEIISDIKFSLSCAKRGLINCMRQLDAGSNDPEMHNSVNAYQKEIRDSSKMINDLMTKMKGFYKELRDEYEHKEIIEQNKAVEIQQQKENLLSKDNEELVIFDPKRMNKIIENYKTDSTLVKLTGTTHKI